MLRSSCVATVMTKAMKEPRACGKPTEAGMLSGFPAFSKEMDESGTKTYIKILTQLSGKKLVRFSSFWTNSQQQG